MACTAQARHCWEYDGQLWRETGRTVVEHNMGAMVNYEGDLVLIGNTLYVYEISLSGDFCYSDPFSYIFPRNSVPN